MEDCSEQRLCVYFYSGILGISFRYLDILIKNVIGEAFQDCSKQRVCVYFYLGFFSPCISVIKKRYYTEKTIFLFPFTLNGI